MPQPVYLYAMSLLRNTPSALRFPGTLRYWRRKAEIFRTGAIFLFIYLLLSFRLSVLVCLFFVLRRRCSLFCFMCVCVPAHVCFLLLLPARMLTERSRLFVCCTTSVPFYILLFCEAIEPSPLLGPYGNQGGFIPAQYDHAEVLSVGFDRVRDCPTEITVLANSPSTAASVSSDGSGFPSFPTFCGGISSITVV